MPWNLKGLGRTRLTHGDWTSLQPAETDWHLRATCKQTRLGLD